jgi:HD-like signal output (HDOD) protein
VTDQNQVSQRAPAPQAQTFIIDLERELLAGSLTIAGLPSITGELLRQLSDDFGSNYQLARLIQREPELTTRIIGMANSVAFRPAGRAPRELGAAIARLGHDTLRVVLLAFSLSVLRAQPEYTVVREPLGRLWERAIRMSSLCRGLSATLPSVTKDSAILAGLLHNMGKIVLLARAAWYAPLLEDVAALEHVLQTWQARTSRQLLTKWDFAPDIVLAVSQFHLADDAVTDLGTEGLRLRDTLALADSLVDLSVPEDGPDPWDRVLKESPSARRLGFSAMDPGALRQLVLEETEQLMVVLN